MMGEYIDFYIIVGYSLQDVPFLCGSSKIAEPYDEDM